MYTNEVGSRATRYGIIAQLGEHLPYKQRVIGSRPIGPIYTSIYGEIAQLARARGSYPRCRWFKSSSRYLCKKRNLQKQISFCGIRNCIFYYAKTLAIVAFR